MKPLEPCFIVRVFILTDKLGEWWEQVKTNGSTAMHGDDKYFKHQKDAERCARHFTRAKVVRLDPPQRPSRTWRETVVHERTDTR